MPVSYYNSPTHDDHSFENTVLKDDIPNVCFEEKIIPKTIFELPQSTDSDFATLMPILVVSNDPMHFFFEN